MLTREKIEAAEEALRVALAWIGRGTNWHENHYPALRAALDTVPVEPESETLVESPTVEISAEGGEIASTDAGKKAAKAK